MKNKMPFLTEGVVIANNDEDQMGRIKVWIPAVDGEKYDVDVLPWAQYVSPSAGVTTNNVVGREKDFRAGPVAYGFWAIPKINAIVLVMFLNGDTNRRFYIGSSPGLHTNRSLPAGRNIFKENNNEVGPFTDTYEKMQPSYRNLRAAFGNDPSVSEAKTRGFYERQVAQEETSKNGAEGYAHGTVDTGNLDPQTYCWSTPGGHFITMVDDPANCRLRVKTTSGNQILLDDTNERIYISSARGGTWIEMDEDGHLHMFANDSFSVTSGADINFTAKKNFNVEVGGQINLKAEECINIDSNCNLNITIAGSVMMTACSNINLLASNEIICTATNIHLNGPQAARAKEAGRPSIVPSHEPWKRPASSVKRNPSWKP